MYPHSEKSEITRLPKRGTYHKEAIHAILDDTILCHLSFAIEGQPFIIPTGFVRMGEAIYVHGSVGSGYMRQLTEGLPVTIAVTHLDGLVLARSAFHHSVNYRSVVVFSHAQQVTDRDELYASLAAFTDKVAPGRWNDARQPTDSEWKKTLVLKFPIEEASAKIRTGGPKDDEEDYTLPIWAGVLPLRKGFEAPIPDEAALKPVPLPDYLQELYRGE